VPLRDAQLEIESIMGTGRFHLGKSGYQKLATMVSRSKRFSRCHRENLGRRDAKHRLQENEENRFLPAAYRSSNLGQANITLVRRHQDQVHGVIAPNWPEQAVSGEFGVLGGSSARGASGLNRPSSEPFPAIFSVFSS
jgi:hypothetical protein